MAEAEGDLCICLLFAGNRQTSDKDSGQLSSGGLTCLWLRRQNFCGWAEGWTWESPRFSVWSYIRRRQQCRRARHPARSLLLSPSLIPFAIVLGHFPPEIARSNVGRRRCNRRRSCWERPRRQSRGNTQWKEYYGRRPSLAKCDTQKGVKGPRNPVRRGEGEEGEDNEPNLWEAFAPRSHKSQPIMVKSTIG